MKLEEMKVCDVLRLPLFRQSVTYVLDKMVAGRNDAIFRYGNIKRTSYDRLKEKGIMRADKIPIFYELVIDKKLTGFSSDERKLIKQIGDSAFYRTMTKLKNEENK